MLDSREITPEEFRDAMAHHARGLIAEMEEVHQNPVAAWLETLKNRRAASRLAREHGEHRVREILVALSEVPDFPLANWLWDADQPTVPLYCFLRTRREPVFRVLKIASAPFVLSVTVEHGGLKRGTSVREQFRFGRDRIRASRPARTNHAHLNAGQGRHCAIKTSMKQTVVTLDLEGVLVPEIWIAFADKTGIKELRRTTRDEPDYDILMQGRLKILDEHGLKLADIQEVIGTLAPLDGAKAFLDELRSITQVIILSDTFEQFASPLMRQLGWPALFCHRLEVDGGGRIVNYRLRQPNQKQHSVAALKSLNYRVIAAGDSFNDTTMLAEADNGFFFHAPESIQAQFPQFPPFEEYNDLLAAIKGALPA